MSVNNNIINFLINLDITESFITILNKAIDRVKSADLTIHPYGFFIVKPLVNSKRQIRLHIWLPGNRRRQKPDWPTHNHNFDLHSVIIKGELTHHIWEVTSNIDSPLALHKVSYIDSISKLTRIPGTVACKEINSDAYTSGNSYFLGKHTYHSVDVLNYSATITLCVMTSPDDAPQYVVGETAGKGEYTFLRNNVFSEDQNLIMEELNKLSYLPTSSRLKLDNK